MRKMKLSYFNLYGRAEPIRIMLNYFKVDYEDERVEFKDWPAMKPDAKKVPYGTMPVLSCNGKTYCTSAAILKFIGSMHGAFPTDAKSLYRVEQVIDLWNDFWTIFSTLFKAKPEEKEEKLNEIMKNTVPKFFKYWDDLIKKNNCPDFIVGKKATVADFLILHGYTLLKYGDGTKDA